MMFVNYAEHESDSVRIWDPSMNRVVMTRDEIWLQCMQFQSENVVGVLELKDAIEDNGKVVSPIEDMMPDMNVRAVKPGGRVI